MNDQLQKPNRLRVVKVVAGAKNKHRMAMCVCECGEPRNVRADRLARGEIVECAKCSMATSRNDGKFARRRLDDMERTARNAFGEYRGNARRKSIRFELTLDDVRQIVASTCHYCGRSGPVGIDRRDNTQGYVASNVLSCCSVCNYAKRSMTTEAFFLWIEAVYRHAKTHNLLQRNRPEVLRVDKPIDGRRADNAGCYQ